MGEQLGRGRMAYPTAEGIAFGPGSASVDVAPLVDRVGGTRVLVVSTPSVTRSGILDEVRGPLADRVVATFDESCEHTPAPLVLEAAALAADAEVDVIVSVGGSSVVDLAKGVALVLAEGAELETLRVIYTPGQGATRPHLAQPKVPHLAVPTTLSGAEFTGIAGITDPVRGAKDLYADNKLMPRWVVLDGRAARDTPSWLWASTGMKVLSDSIEALCSRRANPISDAAALGAQSVLVELLARTTDDAADEDGRGRCLMAVATVLPSVSTVGVGLVAAFRHQIGGGHGVAHGVASTIMLPHVLAWNAAEAADRLARAARAVGAAAAGDSDGIAADRLIERLRAMAAELGLPERLRDVGVPRDALSSIAAHAASDLSAATNPRPVRSPDELETVLEAAW